MNRPTDLGPMGEAAPVTREQFAAKRPVNRERVNAHKQRMLAQIRAHRRPNILIIVGWLFLAALILKVIVEVTL